MTSSISVSSFNSTVVDMINDLATALPTANDLSIVANLASGMLKLDPNNTTILDTFYPIISEHAILIEQRDDTTILELLKSILPGQYANTADTMWEQLSVANKDTVWEYIELLKQQALALKEEKHKGKGIPNNSELFTLYNNIWKEFLTQLSKTDTKHKKAWAKAIDNIAVLTTPEKTAIHTSFFEMFGSQSTRIKGTPDIMNLIMPKDVAFMKSELERDIGKFGKLAFPLNTDMSMGSLLKITSKHSTNNELPVYWHYLKVLTLVLAECPPELADLLSSMASNLSTFMQPMSNAGKESA